MSLVLPDGYKLGCKLRRSYPGQHFKLLEATGREIIPREQIADLIDPDMVRQMREAAGRAFDQGKVGSCAAEAATKGVMTRAVYDGYYPVLLNPLSIYAHTSGGRDQGSSIGENLRFIQYDRKKARGILPESVWPRSKGWRAKPPEEYYHSHGNLHIVSEAYDLTSTDEVRTALVQPEPVLFGARGHAQLLLGLLDRDTALCLNSWNPTWGPNGDGTHPYKLSAINFAYGCYAVGSVVAR